MTNARRSVENFGDEVVDDGEGSDANVLRDDQISLVHDTLDSLSDDRHAILVL